MLKLYGGSRSRASIVQWYLEELGLNYEFVILDMKAGEHLQPKYLAINPFGKVPGLVDDEFIIWESGAILLYLAEKYGKPPLSIEQKCILTQWVLFANSTLWSGVFVEANRDREMPKIMTTLNNILEGQTFLLGNILTVADIAVASILAYIPVILKIDLSGYPAITEYMQRIADRPAFKKTISDRK